MKLTFFLIKIVILVLFIKPIFAGLGRPIAKHKLPGNLCLLDYTKEGSEIFSEVCSGTLINSSTILTAAHCLQRKMPREIRCGYDLVKVEYDPRDKVAHPLHERDVVVNGTGIHINDVALIFLKKPVAINPISLGTLKNSDQSSWCGFFGFSKFLGKLKIDILDEELGWYVNRAHFTEFTNDKVLQLEGMKAPGALLQVGDSGGPLMCYRKNQWHLLGVNSSRDFKARSNFMQLSQMDFVKVGIEKFDSTYINGFNKHSFELRELKRVINEMKKKMKRLKFKESHFLTRATHIENLIDSSLSTHVIEKAIKKLKNEVILFLMTDTKVALRLKPYSQVKIEKKPNKKSLGDLGLNFFQIKDFDLEKGTALGTLKAFGPSDYFTCNGEILCATETIKNVTISIQDFTIYKADASRVFD